MLALRLCLFGLAINAATSASVYTRNADHFHLSIIHFNDFHARFEEISPKSTACKANMSDCIGGISRLYTAIHHLLKTRPNPVVLNAGDNFQGTPWYSMYKWNITQYFINMLPVDATTLGNHEFDDSIPGIVPFIKALNSPTIIANMDATDEPTLANLTRPSVVLERGGKRIGIIGVIYESVPESSKTGRLRFTNESEAVRREAVRLRNQENCDIVVVLSHCGVVTDQWIARNGGPIDVIVGGHSHTLLWHGDGYPGVDKPKGDYPIVVEQDNGHRVLVVQALCFTKVLGNITLEFDADNRIISWEGNPIYLDRSIARDPTIDEMLVPWRESVDEYTGTIVGTTKVDLPVEDCWTGECGLGNLITDAVIYNSLDDETTPAEWTRVALAITHSGGIREGIPKGSNVTIGDILTILPFGGTFDIGELRGDWLRQMFEHSVAEEYNPRRENGRFRPRWPLQVSGFQVVFNTSRPVGSRVTQLLVRCQKCSIPSFAPLDPVKFYRFSAPNYLMDGGDGFTMIAENLRNRISGALDMEIVTNYVKRVTPLVQGVEGRSIMVF